MSGGLVHERSRNRHPLLLSAGQFDGTVAQAVVQSHALQTRRGARDALRPWHACEQEWKRHVVDCVHRRDQIELLEDHADLGSPVGGTVPTAHPHEIPGPHLNGSVRDDVHRSEQMEQRRLA
jgi:hypothetical protein